MPNWVYNSLKVHGTPDKLDKFLEEIKSKTDSDPISFENIVPIDHTKYYTKAWFRDGKKSLAEFPEHIDNELYDDRTYNDAAVSGAPEVYVADSTEVNDRGDHFAGWAYDWYKAQVNEWGTKWDACDPSLTRINQETAELTFNTAWAAPEPVLQALARKYPELNFEYYCTEESNAFYTYGQSEDGEFDLHDVDPDVIFSDKNKRATITAYVSDPELYDIDSIINDDVGYYCLCDYDGYNGFTNIELDWYVCMDELEPYKTKK